MRPAIFFRHFALDRLISKSSFCKTRECIKIQSISILMIPRFSHKIFTHFYWAHSTQFFLTLLFVLGEYFTNLEAFLNQFMQFLKGFLTNFDWFMTNFNAEFGLIIKNLMQIFDRFQMEFSLFLNAFRNFVVHFNERIDLHSFIRLNKKALKLNYLDTSGKMLKILSSLPRKISPETDWKLASLEQKVFCKHGWSLWAKFTFLQWDFRALSSTYDAFLCIFSLHQSHTCFPPKRSPFFTENKLLISHNLSLNGYPSKPD